MEPAVGGSEPRMPVGVGPCGKLPVGGSPGVAGPDPTAAVGAAATGAVEAAELIKALRGGAAGAGDAPPGANPPVVLEGATAELAGLLAHSEPSCEGAGPDGVPAASRGADASLSRTKLVSRMESFSPAGTNVTSIRSSLSASIFHTASRRAPGATGTSSAPRARYTCTASPCFSRPAYTKGNGGRAIGAGCNAAGRGGDTGGARLCLPKSSPRAAPGARWPLKAPAKSLRAPV
jgi:hypothetical protein